ncbi:beta strand repeat-containing protein, partial [Phaeovulum sp.]|uniref:beta strand repeat-containing protein n=1 Tax=Phaeovulum sp. TaxID=2934796 RepID=UPI003568EC08
MQLTASNVTLAARNITTNPFLAGGATNVNSISGGLANVPAGGATVAITHNTLARVGANAAVRLTQPVSGPSLYKQEAYNAISSKQKVTLDSGGAIATADAVIDALITANATASVGGAGKVKVDYGDIQIAAWGEGDVDMRATATTYGLAGAPSGDANITYTGANTVSIGNDALVQATDGDNPTNGDVPRYATVTIGAGTGPQGQTANLVFNATVDIFNKTAIPIPTGPDPTVIVANSGLVSVGTTSSSNMNLDPQGVRAAGDIRISVSRGNISAKAVGTGKDIYREALAEAASAVSNAFGGGDVTFDYHGGSTSTNGGISRVDINGRVETGIQRHKILTIDDTCTASGCISITSSGNIIFTTSGPNPVGTEILTRVAELAQLILDYDTDPIARAAYQNEINFLRNKLVGLGLGSFDAAGNFVPGDYTGPSPKAALEAAAAADAASISVIKVQLGSVAPTNIVDGLTELTDGVKGLYEDGTYGLIVSVNNTISVIQTMSTYSAGTHGATVTGLQTLRNQGLAAAAAAKVAEADTIVRRDTNIAKAAEIAAAQVLLSAALVSNDATTAAAQQSIIAAAQTTIANNLNVIASNTATISAQSAIARDRATSLATGLNSLLSSLPPNPVTGTDAEKAAAIAANLADTNKRNALLAPGSAADFYVTAGSLTRVTLNKNTLTSTVSDLGAVLTSINSAVTTLNANTGTTPGTVDGTKSLTQFVGLLGSLTTSYATTTQAASTALNSTGTPLAYVIEVADTAARLGNIYITGDQLRTTSSGKLLAPGDAKIQITNNTHHTLKLGNLIVPEYDAGNLRFNGVLVYGPADITSLNAGGLASGFANLDVVTSRTSSRGLVEIISTYTPEAYAMADRKVAPDIILKRGSVIENTTGAVRIISEAGNIYIQGTINAGSVEILAKDGDFVASYVNGFNHIGGDPASFTTHTSTIEPGPGITANGAISISARYLNINSTIQSGIAEWNLTLGGNPTLTASMAAIGVTQAALDAANLIGAPTVQNSAGQAITINRTPLGIDPTELNTVVNQYKDEVLVNPNADPVRTIAIFGVATQVNIKDYLSEQITFSLQFTKAQAEAYVAANPGSDGIFSVVRASAADNIGASYDAHNEQYVVNGASVKGGYIQLFGQIMNTSSSTSVGRLNVLDGFGTINVTNSSNIPVVLRNLSTGEDPTGTLRGIEGRIEITDVTGLQTTGAYSISNPLISVRKTVYTRDYVPGSTTGVVRVATQTGHIDNATGDLILGGAVASTGSDRGASYTPVANQRYVWTTGEEYKRTSNYSKVSTELFGSDSLTVSSITSLTRVGEPQLLNTYRLGDGTYVTSQSTITGGGLSIVNGAAFQDPAATTSSNASLSGTPFTTASQTAFTLRDGDGNPFIFSKTHESPRRCNWWTACIASEKTYYYELRQEYTTIITQSLKADYPIGVNFIGSNTGAINITSTGADVVLTSNINAVAGTVTINAGTTPGSNASIIQGDLAGEIKASTVSLTADNYVGGITNPHSLAAPINAALTVNLTGVATGTGALSANAKNGNVAIIGRSSLIVDQVTAAGDVTAGRGNVNLFSFGSIDGANQSARIQAPRVTLTSLSGSVGSTTTGAMLRVNTGFTADPAQRNFGDPVLDPSLQTNPLFGLSVTAAGDIGIRSDAWASNADGTMLVAKVLTSGGDVRLAATGQILDNNPVQSIDQRTYDQLLGFWESLGLLANDPARGVHGTANEDKQENAVKAFEASTTQTYNQYWRVRGDAAYDPAATITVVEDTAQYRALDAQFRAEAIDAGVADPDAYVLAHIAEFQTRQTDEYHRL